MRSYLGRLKQEYESKLDKKNKQWEVLPLNILALQTFFEIQEINLGIGKSA